MSTRLAWGHSRSKSENSEAEVLAGGTSRKPVVVDFAVLLCGIAHNVASNLDAESLPTRVERIGRSFADYRVIIYENDSRDKTPARLRAWAKRNPHVRVKSEKLGRGSAVHSQTRLQMLGEYRNQVLSLARNESFTGVPFSNFEFIIWLDMDVRPEPPPLDVLRPSLLNTWDAMCASAEYDHKAWGVLQYDALALRDETLPNYYEQLPLQLQLESRPPWNSRIGTAHVHELHFQRRLIHLAEHQNWSLGPSEDSLENPSSTFGPNRSLLLPVHSCMNGLVMYKRRAMEGCAFNGTYDDPWISYNRCLRLKGGNMYLNAAWRISIPSEISGKIQEEYSDIAVSSPDLYRNLPVYPGFQLSPLFMTGLYRGMVVTATPAENKAMPKLMRPPGYPGVTLGMLMNVTKVAMTRAPWNLSSKQAGWMQERLSDLREMLQLAGWRTNQHHQSEENSRDVPGIAPDVDDIRLTTVIENHLQEPMQILSLDRVEGTKKKIGELAQNRVVIFQAKQGSRWLLRTDPGSSRQLAKQCIIPSISSSHLPHRCVLSDVGSETMSRPEL